MLVRERSFTEEDASIGYYEAIFDSSNILKTTYFPQQERLYISFNRGGVYSYQNISQEKYDEFKKAESQGKFFIQEIKKKPDEYPYRKEFTLYPEEVNNIKEERDNNKEKIPIPKINNKIYHNIDENEIIFTVGDEETIKISNEGFYWKGDMIENDEEIYDKFKEWLEYAWGELETKSNYYKVTDWIERELKHLQNKTKLTQFEEGQLYELKILKQWI
jgi:hypothetical protein